MNRREFFTAATAAGAALVLPVVAEAQPEPVKPDPVQSASAGHDVFVFVSLDALLQQVSSEVRGAGLHQGLPQDHVRVFTSDNHRGRTISFWCSAQNYVCEHRIALRDISESHKVSRLPAYMWELIKTVAGRQNIAMGLEMGISPFQEYPAKW